MVTTLHKYNILWYCFVIHLETRMRFRGLGDKLILVLGDLVAFGLALRLAISLRELFGERGLLFSENLLPFALLFFVWVVVFFVFGLYDKRSLTIARGLPMRLLRLQMGNSFLAVLVFYFVPALGIAPKTLLLFNVVTTWVLLVLWRLLVVRTLGKGKKERVLLVGENMEDLQHELELHPFYGYAVSAVPQWNDIVAQRVKDEKIRTIICNPLALEESGRGSDLAELIFRGVRIIDRRDLYEEVMQRIPLAFISESWILRYIALPQRGYDIAKRVMDLVIALPLALLSLVVYPFVILAIKMEDKGPVFIHQQRIGRGGKPIHITKFRSMTGNDSGDYGAGGMTKLRVTRVGAFLRVSRLDELPQLWSVVRGALSLVGPRPELPALVKQYEQEIPFYNLRHLITPGLSGWAQIYHENHPHHGSAVELTREKLSYDLYYVKNRSIFLDLMIALKTIKTLLSRSGL